MDGKEEQDSGWKRSQAIQSWAREKASLPNPLPLTALEFAGS
jgi:hypothetical protein